MRALILLLLLTASALAYNEQTDEAWKREPNITLNYSKIPWILLGITPRFEHPLQRQYDTIVVPPEPPRLDPRTCPEEVAQCYQILEHNFTGNFTHGKNYTSVSKYILPEKRIRYFVCVGEDLDCVSRATNCFCPTNEASPVPQFKTGKCSGNQHICKKSYSGFVLCNGNISSCEEQYESCSCGKYGVCFSHRESTCVTSNDELFLCKDTFSSCLGRYKTCFCGNDMMKLNAGCETLNHECVRNGKNYSCYGKLADCAVKYDECSC